MGGGSHSVPPFLALKKSVPPLLKMVVFLPFSPPFSLHFFLLNGAPSILSQVCSLVEILRYTATMTPFHVCHHCCWYIYRKMEETDSISSGSEDAQGSLCINPI